MIVEIRPFILGVIVKIISYINRVKTLSMVVSSSIHFVVNVTISSTRVEVRLQIKLLYRHCGRPVTTNRDNILVTRSLEGHRLSPPLCRRGRPRCPLRGLSRGESFQKSTVT